MSATWEIEIQRVFCPQTESEKTILLSIAKEAEFIDIKPFSHNIVSLNLLMLVKNEGYYTAKIQEVVRMFGLDKKGWDYILTEEYEKEVFEESKKRNEIKHAKNQSI
jgi:hypothetical protein